MIKFINLFANNSSLIYKRSLIVYEGKLICNLNLEDTTYRDFYNRLDNVTTDIDERDHYSREGDPFFNM